MKIRKSDTVKILYGKDSGKTGKVVLVDPKNSKLVVEGVNVFKKHVKGDGQTRKSEIVDVMRPVSSAKVALLCPHCGKPTRVVMTKEGKNFVRTCKKCGKGLDVKVAKVEEKKEEVKSKKVSKKK